MERPFVTLTYAQSLDGSLGSTDRRPLALSGPAALRYTHELRAAHDAILIGIGTLLADDPRLTVRLVEGPNPRPVVLDSTLRCPTTARLLATGCAGPAPWLATTARAADARQTELEAAGAEVWRLPADASGRVALRPLLADLQRAGVRRLMVEGGSRVIASFLAAGLVDRLIVTIAPRLVGGLPAVADLPLPPRLHNVAYQVLGDDIVVCADIAWDGD